MTTYTYALADIDGVLCVTSTGAAWDKPELHTVHWPTTVRTNDLLRYCDCTLEELHTFKVKNSMPGEFWIEDVRYHSGNRGSYISLTNGSRTQSIKLTTAPYPAPKRAKNAKYENGAWHKQTAKGWIRV